MKHNIVSLSLFKYMMKPDRVLQMIRLNQPHIVVGMNWTATEFIFYKLSVTTSNCFRNWAKVPQFVSLNLTQRNAAKKNQENLKDGYKCRTVLVVLGEHVVHDSLGRIYLQTLQHGPETLLVQLTVHREPLKVLLVLFKNENPNIGQTLVKVNKLDIQSKYCWY